jgi:ribosomal protein L30/L7E
MLDLTGLKRERETVELFNDKTVRGSISMASFKVSL